MGLLQSFESQTQGQTEAPEMSNQRRPDLQNKSRMKRPDPACGIWAEAPSRALPGEKGPGGREGGREDELKDQGAQGVPAELVGGEEELPGAAGLGKFV